MAAVASSATHPSASGEAVSEVPDAKSPGFRGEVPTTLRRILDAAQRFARDAGKIMIERGGESGDLGIEAKSSSKDLVTKIDKACQDVIEKGIKAEFPDHAMLGEESTEAGSAASTEACRAALKAHDATYLWIVDPVDGTTMLVFDCKCSVVSIGVAHKGEVVVGVIYYPYRDEMFCAVKDCGATLNGEPIRVDAGVTSLSRALVAYGHHTQREARETMYLIGGALAEKGLAVRNLGSAALHLAYIACGRLSAFVELDLNSWDLAAGSLLVTEAGGRCSDTRGAPYEIATRDMLATNGQGAVHDEILGLLERLGTQSILPSAVVDRILEGRWGVVARALEAIQSEDGGSGKGSDS